MKKFFIQNLKTDETYKKSFVDTEECKHWIINHLDLSLNWGFQEVLNF